MGDEATVPAASTDPKPGYKTTEFYLTLIGNLVGILLLAGVFPVDSALGKVLGAASLVLSNLGYGISRAMVKSAAQVALLVLLPFFMIGCSKGMIRADAIAPLTTDVCDRHDAILTGKLDPKTISEADKATYLRSSALLRKALQEAKN